MDNYCKISKSFSLSCCVRRVVCILVILSLGHSFQVSSILNLDCHNSLSSRSFMYSTEISFIQLFLQWMLDREQNRKRSVEVIKIVRRVELNCNINCNYIAKTFTSDQEVQRNYCKRDSPLIITRVSLLCLWLWIELCNNSSSSYESDTVQARSFPSGTHKVVETFKERVVRANELLTSN